jgi:hypothetical protein
LIALTRTRTGARPADKCAHGWTLPGNAAQYRAFVFNFARTWESIYLNFALDAAAPRRSSLPIRPLLKPRILSDISVRSRAR